MKRQHYLLYATIAVSLVIFTLVLRSRVIFSQLVENLAIASLSFSLAVTIGATGGISFRLWRAGRTGSSLTDHNPYKAAMYSIIESGAIYTACSVVLTALLLVGNPVGGVSINVNIQVTVGNFQSYASSSFSHRYPSRPWHLFFS
jgi:hypothetical protein